MKRVSLLTPWLIWGLAAFFFFSHYVVRVTPGQISEQLQAIFHTSKFKLGLLGSSFYFPYVLMQMPIGYLVDRFGSRLLLTIAVLICGFSSLLFANAHLLTTAIFSRVLLGLCSAAAFIGALKLITVWFAPNQLALLVGITQALGMAGAAVGTQLAPQLNELIGWRNIFYLYALIFFILTLFIFIWVKNQPPSQKAQHAMRSNISLAQLNQVIFNKFTWLNALYAGLIYAPTDVMGEFWGSEFIKKIHEVNAQQAASIMSFLFIGWAIGGPIAGWIADHIGRRKVMIISALLGLLLLPLVFYIPALPPSLLMIIMFCYGLTNTGLIASYTTAGELHDKSLSGFSMAIANMLSVLIGAGLISLIGKLLDWHAASHSNGDNTIIYTISDYQQSTYILPCCLLAALGCALLSKETLKKCPP